jgi:hypothetical protein
VCRGAGRVKGGRTDNGTEVSWKSRKKRGQAAGGRLCVNVTVE